MMNEQNTRSELDLSKLEYEILSAYKLFTRLEEKNDVIFGLLFILLLITIIIGLVKYSLLSIVIGFALFIVLIIVSSLFTEFYQKQAFDIILAAQKKHNVDIDICFKIFSNSVKASPEQKKFLSTVWGDINLNRKNFQDTQPKFNRIQLEHEILEAYEVFRISQEKKSAIIGTIFIFLLIVGIVGWINYSWLSGIIGLSIFIISVIISNLLYNLKKQAYKNILDMQKKYNIDIDILFNIFYDLIKENSKKRSFISAVWGDDKIEMVESNGDEHVFEENGFKMTIPKGWQKQRRKLVFIITGGKIAYTSPDKEASINISTGKLDRPEWSDRFVRKMAMNRFLSGNPNSDYIEELDIMLGGEENTIGFSHAGMLGFEKIISSYHYGTEYVI